MGLSKWKERYVEHRFYNVYHVDNVQCLPWTAVLDPTYSVKTWPYLDLSSSIIDTYSSASCLPPCILPQKYISIPEITID